MEHQENATSEKRSARIFAVILSTVMFVIVSVFLLAEVRITLRHEVSNGTIVSNYAQFMFFFREIRIEDEISRKIYSCRYVGLLSNDYDSGAKVEYRKGTTLAVIPSLLPNILLPPILLELLALYIFARVGIGVVSERRRKL